MYNNFQGFYKIYNTALASWVLHWKNSKEVNGKRNFKIISLYLKEMKVLNYFYGMYESKINDKQW